MSISGEKQQVLTRLLAAELKSARQLQMTLNQEFEALSKGDADGIAEIIAQKQCQTLELAQHLQSRDTFLAGLALPAGQPGTEAIIAQLPADTQASNLWRELQSAGQRLRDSNEVNGGMIAHSQRHLQQAVAILRGQAGRGDTYGREGAHRPGRLSQSLAKA